MQKSLAYKKPFVFYRKPNSNIVCENVQLDNELYFLDNYNEKGFIFAPFDNTEKTILFPLDKTTISKHVYLVNPLLSETVINDVEYDNHKKNHIDLVNSGIEYIKNNKVPKIVLSRKETIHKKDVDIVAVFENLLNKYEKAFVYVWFHPKVGLWLGATPETLLNTHNNNFKTMSLAGTQVFNKNTDVFWEEKEIQEHKFVTDYIVEELNKLNITCNVTLPTTIKAGNLLHIQVNISGRLKNTSVIDKVIKALHPTPAICGLPKEKAKNFILKNENYNREFYTGFLGELNFELDKRQNKNNKRNIENHAYNFKQIQSALFVNLRCMQIKKNEISIYVGGGITKDSNAEKEYFETVAKSKVMKSVIIPT